MTKYWWMVIGAGVVEILWVTGLKHADSPLTWGLTLLTIIASFYLLMQSMAHLPTGVVYPMFTGIGTVGTVLTETFIFGEPISVMKVILISTLLFGIIGLKMVSDNSTAKERV